MTIHEVKKSLGRRVSYNGSDCYELTGCIIRKSSKTGQFFYQAEIADKTCGNTLVYCRLEELRCNAVQSGEKTFEVRKNDRGFQTGDLIRFIPTDGTSYRSSDGTVREHAKHEISGHTYKITYILNGWGIKNGYVVMGIREEGSYGKKRPYDHVTPESLPQERLSH